MGTRLSCQFSVTAAIAEMHKLPEMMALRLECRDYKSRTFYGVESLMGSLGKSTLMLGKDELL